MRDIFPPQPRTKPKNTRFPVKSLVQYGLSFLILLLIIYFGLGYASGYIDTWLKLEPINLTNNMNSLDEELEETNNQITENDLNQITDNIPSDDPENRQESNDSKTPVTPTPSGSEVDKTTISLQILNGNSLWGSAAKAKTILEEAGFKVASIGNASSQNYPETKIYYQTSKKAEAELVKQALEKNYQGVLEENNQLASQFQVLI